MGLVRIRDRLICVAPGGRPEQTLLMDASCMDGRGVAAIAVVLEGGPELVCEVVPATSSTGGEMAALDAAMRLARARGWERVLFKTDASAVAHNWGMWRIPEPEWRLQRVPRYQVKRAHQAARQLARRYREGSVAGPR